MMFNCQKNHSQFEFFKEKYLIFRDKSDKPKGAPERLWREERAIQEALNTIDEIDKINNLEDLLDYVKKLEKIKTELELSLNLFYLNNKDNPYEWTVEPIKKFGKELDLSRKLCDRIMKRKDEIVDGIVAGDITLSRRAQKKLQSEIASGKQAIKEEGHSWDGKEAQEVRLYYAEIRKVIAIKDEVGFRAKAQQLVRDGYVQFNNTTGEFETIDSDNDNSARLARLLNDKTLDFDIGPEDFRIEQAGPAVPHGEGINVEQPFKLGEVPKAGDREKAEAAAKKAIELQGVRDPDQVVFMQNMHQAVRNHIDIAFLEHVEIKTHNKKDVSKEVYAALDAVLEDPYKFTYIYDTKANTYLITLKNDPDFLIAMNTDYRIIKVHDIPLAESDGTLPWWKRDRYFQKSILYDKQLQSALSKMRTPQQLRQLIQGLSPLEARKKLIELLAEDRRLVPLEVKNAMVFQNVVFVERLINSVLREDSDYKYDERFLNILYHFSRQGKNFEELMDQGGNPEIIVVPDPVLLADTQKMEPAYTIYTQTNQDNPLRVNLKGEVLVKTPSGWLPDIVYTDVIRATYYRDNPNAAQLDGVDTSGWERFNNDRDAIINAGRIGRMLDRLTVPQLQTLVGVILPPRQRAAGMSRTDIPTLKLLVRVGLNEHPGQHAAALNTLNGFGETVELNKKRREVNLLLGIVPLSINDLRTIAIQGLPPSNDPNLTQRRVAAINGITDVGRLHQLIQTNIEEGRTQYTPDLAQIFRPNFVDRAKLEEIAIALLPANSAAFRRMNEAQLRTAIQTELNANPDQHDRALAILRLYLADLEALKRVAERVFPENRKKEISAKKYPDFLRDEIKVILTNDPTQYDAVFDELYE